MGERVCGEECVCGARGSKWGGEIVMGYREPPTGLAEGGVIRRGLIQL